MKAEPPKEKAVQDQIIKALKAYGVTWMVKTHGGAYQRPGLPDILAAAPKTGRLVGIEVKRPVIGKVTAMQTAEIRKINEGGGVAGLAYCEADAIALIKRGDGE